MVELERTVQLITCVLPHRNVGRATEVNHSSEHHRSYDDAPYNAVHIYGHPTLVLPDDDQLPFLQYYFSNYLDITDIMYYTFPIAPMQIQIWSWRQHVALYHLTTVNHNHSSTTNCGFSTIIVPYGLADYTTHLNAPYDACTVQHTWKLLDQDFGLHNMVALSKSLKFFLSPKKVFLKNKLCGHNKLNEICPSCCFFHANMAGSNEKSTYHMYQKVVQLYSTVPVPVWLGLGIGYGYRTVWYDHRPSGIGHWAKWGPQCWDSKEWAPVDDMDSDAEYESMEPEETAIWRQMTMKKKHLTNC